MLSLIKNLSILVLILALISCDKNSSSSSGGNLTAEGLIGTWSVSSEFVEMFVTTNNDTEILDVNSPGTGSLTVTGEINTSLNFMSLWDFDWTRDGDLDQIGISSMNYYDVDWDGYFDYYEYLIYYNNPYGNSSHLMREWSGEPGSLSFSGSDPSHTFNDFTLTVNNDEMYSYNYESNVYTYCYVNGTVTGATLNLPDGQSRKIDEYTHEYDDQRFFTFHENGTFTEEDYYSYYYYYGLLSDSYEGTWEVLDGNLFITSDDDEGNPVTVIYSGDIDGDEVTLSISGNACEDSDPDALNECFDEIASDYWGLEGTDIESASGTLIINMVKYEEELPTLTSYDGHSIKNPKPFAEYFKQKYAYRDRTPR